MHIAMRNLKNCFIALALLAFAPGVLAVDSFTQNWWEEVACPSENVYVEGTVRIQLHQVQTEGHMTSYFYAFWTGSGYGVESGNEYMIKGKWMEVVQNLAEDAPYLFIWNDHFQLIGKGAAPNYEFHNKLRILVNANGEPVIELEDVEWPCDYVDGS